MDQPYPPGDIVSGRDHSTRWRSGSTSWAAPSTAGSPTTPTPGCGPHAPVYYDEANDIWAAASLRRRQGGLGRHRDLLQRPGHPAQVPAPADDDRLRRPRARAPAAAGVRGLHAQAGPGHGGPAPGRLRPHHRLGVRAGQLRLRRRHCRAAAHRRHRRHARRGAGGPGRPAARGPTRCSGPRGRPTPRPWSGRCTRSWTTPPTSTRSSTTAATGSTDDLVGVLCHAEIDGDPLDDDSLIHETLLILIGGDETTRHVISGGMEELLAHPDQLARLAADPYALLPGCGRGDAALGHADQEHGPHGHPRRRARRRHHPAGRRAPAALPVGQPGRGGVRQPRHLRHRRAAPTRTSPSASGPTSAWATSWPGWSSR